MALPRLSVSIPMIGRILLLALNIIIIGIIGYYFAYYRGSYRHNLFDEELMMLVCAVSAFINTVIMVTNLPPTRRETLSMEIFRWWRPWRLPTTNLAPACRPVLLSSSPTEFLHFCSSLPGWFFSFRLCANYYCFYSWGMFSFSPISDVDTRQIFRSSLRGQGVQWSIGPC